MKKKIKRSLKKMRGRLTAALRALRGIEHGATIVGKSKVVGTYRLDREVVQHEHNRAPRYHPHMPR